METICPELLRTFTVARKNDSNKHDYGHALLICGCETMPGAAVIATGAALHSGCGLVTLRTTAIAAQAAMVRYPSAMLSRENDSVIASDIPDLGRYTAIGIGPGLGRSPKTAVVLRNVLTFAKESHTRMVLDADALNLIASDESLRALIPEGAVMTPHEGELRRLFSYSSEEEKEKIVSAFCREKKVVLVSKGYRTKIFTESGEVYENTTGNPGMAKGGSGDVLTGLITGLLAAGSKSAPESDFSISARAAMLGVWIHGFAGDRLAEERTAECWCAQDLVDRLYLGFKEIYSL